MEPRRGAPQVALGARNSRGKVGGWLTLRGPPDHGHYGSGGVTAPPRSVKGRWRHSPPSLLNRRSMKNAQLSKPILFQETRGLDRPLLPRAARASPRTARLCRATVAMTRGKPCQSPQHVVDVPLYAKEARALLRNACFGQDALFNEVAQHDGKHKAETFANTGVQILCDNDRVIRWMLSL